MSAAPRPPCFAHPEHWDVDNPGARLALLLCRVACPPDAFAACADAAGRTNPGGTIRAGVAYLGRRPLPICAVCGYPVTGRACTVCWAVPGEPAQPAARRAADVTVAAA